MLSGIVDFCLPAACASCDRPLDQGSFLCPACSINLDQLIDSPACSICAMPLAQHHAPCPYCRGGGVPFFDRVASLGRFDEPLKGLIHRMKYQAQWTIGEHLAMRLKRSPRAAQLLAEADAIVPVPLHHLRHLSRGYNQATIIAKMLGPLPVLHAAKRLRHTQSQTHLHSHAQRLENLRGAFRLRKRKSIEGKRLVVVDDVMTSGATLQSTRPHPRRGATEEPERSGPGDCRSARKRVRGDLICTWVGPGAGGKLMVRANAAARHQR